MTDVHSAAAALALLIAAGGLLLVPQRLRSPKSPADAERAKPPVRPVRRAVVGAVAVAVAGVALAPTWWWLIAPAAGLVGVLLGRAAVGASPAKRAADRRLVAVYAELLAACLDAGMAVAPALRAVSAVLAGTGPPGSRAARPGESVRTGGSGRGPGSGGARVGVGARRRPGGSGRPGESRGTGSDAGLAGSAADLQEPGPLAVLDSVAAMLSLGADPRIAWRIADLDDLVAPLAAAARRSAAGGSGLADAVREHAAQLRQEIAAASVRSAGRAGVLMTAPLGVCFLPAFLCLGLAPVVVGLLRQLSIF